ncbi:MAG: hypothetical protein EOM03_02345 [Clostridia bacterium]|nr:hypothetical protein [Clostridia bacterium]NLF20742.1 hypothetical protein [Clostridiaceae bacterium]
MTWLKYGEWFKRTGLVLLSASVVLGASACNDDDKTQSTTTPPTTTQALVTDPVVQVTEADLPAIQAYIESCVNGPFREYVTFPDFFEVSQLPPVVFAGSNLLREATLALGSVSFPRSSYQQYLQRNFNPELTLPANANYQIAYDQAADSFNSYYEPDKRNFTPFSFWLDASLSQEGTDIYFDAYEISYEYVNADSGREERDNPIARMVCDEVTIGFSAPIARRDLHLIDHRPLAKTRYTLQASLDGGYNLISKTKLKRDNAYKASALEMFEDVRATRGMSVKLNKSRLNVRAWATQDSEIVGTLDEGTKLWYINPLPETGFVIGAPAARSAVFNYNLGFGFLSANFVG